MLAKYVMNGGCIHVIQMLHRKKRSKELITLGEQSSVLNPAMKALAKYIVFLPEVVKAGLILSQMIAELERSRSLNSGT